MSLEQVSEKLISMDLAQGTSIGFMRAVNMHACLCPGDTSHTLCLTPPPPTEKQPLCEGKKTQFYQVCPIRGEIQEMKIT